MMNTVPGRETDWVSRALGGELIVDIGQIPRDQEERIQQLVGEGILVRGTSPDYPTPSYWRTAYLHRDRVQDSGTFVSEEILIGIVGEATGNTDWVSRIMAGETVTDIGQIPPDQKRKIQALVRKGVVRKAMNWAYPIQKTAYVHRDHLPGPNVTIE